jgi:formylglycine-generating enzyme required for sulfatase activity/energy-coupling factor transporter ATP-binding protein EcfA2
MGKKRLSLRRFAEWLGLARPEQERAPQIEGNGADTEIIKGNWADTEIIDATDDRFYFQDYAAVLANRTITAEAPLTIGIFGRWGSGKTSLMRLIDAALEKEAESGRRLHRIWINVWRLSNRDEVWQAFLQALFVEVRNKLSRWQRIDKWRLLCQLASNSYRIVLVITPMIVGLLLAKPESGWGDVLQLVLNPIAGGGTLVTVGLGLWTLVKPIIESAREVVSFDLQAVLKYAPYEAQVTELMQLHEQFKETVEVLVGESGRLVVFVDDLDRCSPDKIPEVLEALKLFTTTPRCVYVMGLDHDVALQGVVKKYKFSEDGGAEYLEKIFQVPFHLPPLEDDRIKAFVREDYPDVYQKCRLAPEVFSLGLERNPRKVKRALNIYRTLLHLADARVKAWEMDPVDEELVAKMIVIQSRFRALHEYLVRDPTFLRQVEVKARENGLDSASLKDDEEVGWVLLGKPEAKESEAKPGLIDEVGWSALGAMLRVGEKRFTDPDQRDKIGSYIYLTSTAEGGVERVRPHREERNVLLRGNEEKIKALVDKILKRDADEQAQQRITQAYIGRLEGVLRDLDRYTTAERLSANIALDLLEGRERQKKFEPESLRIPAGPFLMGTSDEQVQDVPRRFQEFTGEGLFNFDVEQPQHEVVLPAYAIGRYPVTNADFARFIEDDSYNNSDYWTEAGWKQRESEGWTQPRFWEDDHFNASSQPVVGVSWYEAVAYCNWLADKTGRPYRLPTEAEWEKAARGEDGRLWPWGNERDPARANCQPDGPGGTTPVDQYSPAGDSPYGMADMAGNVWEWTQSLYKDYPYDPEDGREDLEAGGIRVLRGGAFGTYAWDVRCAFRNGGFPSHRFRFYGFRLVVAPGFTSDL